MEKELMRMEEAQKIVDSFNEEYDLDKLKDEVKDNKIEFSFDNKQYRVRLLTIGEKDELDSYRRKKFGQLIQDKDMLLEKDLIQLYKDRGIDITTIDSDINKLTSEEYNVCLKLGEARHTKAKEVILKGYRDEIKELKQKIYSLTVQKSNLLTYSLESQLKNFVMKVLIYLSLEEKKEREWIRAFSSVEELEGEMKEKLLEKALYYVMRIN